MKTGHTKGPWRMTTNGTKARIEKGTFSPAWIIATVEPKDGKLIAPSEDLANARLIAAAPELLEALSKLSSMVSQDESEYPDFEVYQLTMKADERAKQAIKKALEG